MENMHYFFCGESNIGKVREHNEDAFVFSETLGYAMVSDGMGGLASGEVASQITKESVDAVFKSENQNLPLEQIVKKAIETANSNVRQCQREKPESREMGCTCVLLAFRNNDYCLGYVGDSRIYLFRDGLLKQLTTDHSYVEELFQRGLIKKEEMATHPYRNSITRYVGHKDSIKVDVISGALQVGDRFILCSDGLHNEITDVQIATILQNNSIKPEICVHKLIKSALDHGGKDNVSVVIAAVEDNSEKLCLDTGADDSKNFMTKLLGFLRNTE